MKTTIIAAVARNGTIGRRGDVPWKLPEDLRRFKARTLGHCVAMGRSTWESIGAWPLPGRTNIVLSRSPGFLAPGALVAASLEAAFALGRARGDDELFVAGGAAVYSAALPLVDRLDLTEIERDYDGDTRFPEVDWSAWRLVTRDRREAAGELPAYSFALYERREEA